MTLKVSSDSAVFVDWLDFTLPAYEGYLPAFRSLLESWGFACADRSGVYRVPEMSGVVRLTPDTRGVDRVSLSGTALAYLRGFPGGWSDLLGYLSERAHRITRLDASLDFQTDAPRELQRYRRLVSRTGNQIALTQRATDVTWMLGPDSDGRETGTMYVGKRGKNQVIARVYDKAHEVAQRTGLIIAPTLRFEVEVHGTTGKSRNPCLNDVHDPRSIFWEFASPALLDRPSGVPEWSPVDFRTFTLEETNPDPLRRVYRLLESSGFFPALVSAGAGLDNPSSELRAIVLYELDRALRSSQAVSLETPAK